MARTVIAENSLPHQLWKESVSTICYIVNRCMISPIFNKTPYELWKVKKSNINYFHPFGCKCFIYNKDRDNLDKFDPLSDEGIFLGYSSSSWTYRIFNKHTLCIDKLVHEVLIDTNYRPENIVRAKDEEIAGVPKTI